MDDILLLIERIHIRMHRQVRLERSDRRHIRVRLVHDTDDRRFLAFLQLSFTTSFADLLPGLVLRDDLIRKDIVGILILDLLFYSLDLIDTVVVRFFDRQVLRIHGQRHDHTVLTEVLRGVSRVIYYAHFLH